MNTASAEEVASRDTIVHAMRRLGRKAIWLLQVMEENGDVTRTWFIHQLGWRVISKYSEDWGRGDIVTFCKALVDAKMIHMLNTNKAMGARYALTRYGAQVIEALKKLAEEDPDAWQAYTRRSNSSDIHIIANPWPFLEPTP